MEKTAEMRMIFREKESRFMILMPLWKINVFTQTSTGLPKPGDKFFYLSQVEIKKSNQLIGNNKTKQLSYPALETILILKGKNKSKENRRNTYF